MSRACLGKWLVVYLKLAPKRKFPHRADLEHRKIAPCPLDALVEGVLLLGLSASPRVDEHVVLEDEDVWSKAALLAGRAARHPRGILTQPALPRAGEYRNQMFRTTPTRMRDTEQERERERERFLRETAFRCFVGVSKQVISK